MKRKMMTLLVVIAALSIGYAVVTQRTSQAADNTAASVVATAAAHPGHVMTAAEHIEHMAAEGDPHANHYLMELKWNAMQAAPVNLRLPADNEGSKDRVTSSPRKGQYVKIDVNGTPMTAWLVQPAGDGKAPVVVVIQEIFGLADWIRGVADQLAAEGFIAVAPDLVSGKGPGGGDTPSFATQQDVTAATLALPAADVTAKLKAAREFGLKLPRSNGKSASVGYCFGGSQSFAFAVNEPALNAAVVFYGAAPTDVPPPARGAPGTTPPPPPPFVPSDRLANIKAPILGLYGGLKEDARIGASIAPTEAKMKELGKVYEPHIFEGAAHGFLRAQTGNMGANMKATEQAWPLAVGWIKKYAS